MLKQKFIKQIKALSFACEHLDENEVNNLFGACIKTINGGGKIIVSALGKNVPICDKFSGTLTSLGIRANFLHTNSAVHGDLGLVEKNDLVILISKSGNTSETVYLSELLKKRGSHTWLITCNSYAKSSNFVDKILLLNMKHEGDLWNLVPNNSTILFLMVLQGLAMEIAEKLSVKLDTFKANHPGGNIGKLLENKLTKK